MNCLGFSLDELKKVLINMGGVSYKELEGYKVFSKSGIIFCVTSAEGTYIRMTKSQFRYSKEDTKPIKINDEAYIFNKLDNSISITNDELLTMLTKIYWDLSGKTRLLGGL